MRCWCNHCSQSKCNKRRAKGDSDPRRESRSICWDLMMRPSDRTARDCGGHEGRTRHSKSRLTAFPSSLITSLLVPVPTARASTLKQAADKWTGGIGNSSVRRICLMLQGIRRNGRRRSFGYSCRGMNHLEERECLFRSLLPYAVRLALPVDSFLPFSVSYIPP